jgi:hypothetical protein
VRISPGINQIRAHVQMSEVIEPFRECRQGATWAEYNQALDQALITRPWYSS